MGLPQELKIRLMDKLTGTIGKSMSLPLPLKSARWVVGFV
jgi:hypothetical protein